MGISHSCDLLVHHARALPFIVIPIFQFFIGHLPLHLFKASSFHPSHPKHLLHYIVCIRIPPHRHHVILPSQSHSGIHICIRNLIYFYLLFFSCILTSVLLFTRIPELNLTSSSPPTFSSLYIRLFFFVQSLLNLYKPLHSFDFPAYSSYAYIRSNGIVYHLILPPVA